MSKLDPNIPRLLNIKQKNQERRLAELLNEKRGLEQKLADLATEVATLDARTDGFDQISVANGYLNYVQHRQDALIRQIQVLSEQSDAIQHELRKSLHSRSMLQNPQ
ncbi:MAG: hypothetical protein AAGJ51_10335 [Pseudomonadota bacterium]